ncbi:MAG: hypothetical protein AAF940_14145 [Pseudomonadota bacterium]
MKKWLYLSSFAFWLACVAFAINANGLFDDLNVVWVKLSKAFAGWGVFYFPSVVLCALNSPRFGMNAWTIYGIATLAAWMGLIVFELTRNIPQGGINEAFYEMPMYVLFGLIPGIVWFVFLLLGAALQRAKAEP